MKDAFEPSHVVEFPERATRPDPKFTPGWIELRTGQIHFMNDGRAPQAPYLHGMIDPKGGFYVEPGELKNWMSQKGEPDPKIPPTKTTPLYEPGRDRQVPASEAIPPQVEGLPVAPRGDKPGAYTPAVRCDENVSRLQTIDLLQGYNESNRGRMTTARPYATVPGRRSFQVEALEFSLVRIEGRIFNTGLLQPYGTVPLYSWHLINRRHRTSSEPHGSPVQLPTEDHIAGLVTTSPAFSGANQVLIYVGQYQTMDLTSHEQAGPLQPKWEFQGIEGYIYANACPGTVPLYGWYKIGAGYIITTDPAWSGQIGDTKDGYRLVRIEGYVLPAAER